MKTLVTPSVLSADFGRLDEATEMLNKSAADWIHIDVMDGVFVPNITFGFPVCKALQRKATKPLDVHLMIVRPEQYIEAFHNAGASLISVHIEASTHLHRTLDAIKKLGCKAGVAINPHTPVGALEEILPYADYVCLMSVNPGYSGQKFIPTSVAKVARLRDLAASLGLDTLIQVDGGVDNTNAQALAAAGADVFVSGSYVFSNPDPAAAIASLKIEKKTLKTV